MKPSVELRHWLQSVYKPNVIDENQRFQASMLATLGVRTRFVLGGMTTYPGVGMTIGRLSTSDAAGAPAKAGLTGFRAQLAMRATPFAQ